MESQKRAEEGKKGGRGFQTFRGFRNHIKGPSLLRGENFLKVGVEEIDGPRPPLEGSPRGEKFAGKKDTFHEKKTSGLSISCQPH